MKNVLIIGATSAIAEATARLFAKRGDRLFLVGRNSERLRTIANDLRIRGANHVVYEKIDLNEMDLHETLLKNVYKTMNNLDIVLIAYGTLPEQLICEKDFIRIHKEFVTNALSVISLITHLANYLGQQGKGTLAVIGSPAGDRGKQSNYVYGAAKGSVAIYMEGLRNRLFKSGVHVLTIKPGFVDTPMTANFKKGFLWSQPDDIAKGIVKAIGKQKDVVYLPWYWNIIMLIIRLIPEFIYKRLKF